MTKFQTVKGDLLAVSHGVIIHGCNDKGVMGSGVAAGVKNRFPGAFNIYRQAFDAGELEIGTCTFHQERLNLWIVNAVTQTLGTPNPLSYVGLKECFNQTLAFMVALEQARGIPYGTLPLLFPKIGAARGGGDWNMISAIIEDALTAYETVFHKARPAVLYTIDTEPVDCR